MIKVNQLEQLQGLFMIQALVQQSPYYQTQLVPVTFLASAHALDDNVTNSGMQAFNEAQGVVTTVAHAIDGGGTIAVGTLVDSHMIFLNSVGNTPVSHYNVTWTFSGTILGIMSNRSGTMEANSTFELGAPGTNYTVGAGAAPFDARGLEASQSCGTNMSNDGYSIIAPNQLCVGMYVTEPGDWIRVVTAAVPLPAAFPLLLAALGGLGLIARRRKVA